MADFPYLTKTEKIVMRIFWHADKPLTQLDVMEIARQRGEMKWNPHYIFLVLDSLEKKGVLIESGHTRVGKAYARLFEPVISHVEYVVLYVFEVLHDNEIEEFLAAFTAKKEEKEEAVAQGKNPSAAASLRLNASRSEKTLAIDPLISKKQITQTDPSE